MIAAVDLARPGTDRTAVLLMHVAPPRSRRHAGAAVRVDAHRACELCTHGETVAGQLHCTSPAARLGGATESVAAARSITGSCGPNARHLDMPGWA